MSLLRWQAKLCAAGFLVVAVAALPPQARAQAAPAATWPTGDTSPEEQPLPGQMLGTELSLNQDAGVINAENQSFDRFGLGLSASGGAITNFFGTQTDHVTAGYMQFAAQAGTLLRNSRTRFFALYQPQYNVYPQFTQVNNYSQRAFLSLDRQIAEHADLTWNLTAARYFSLVQYLPETLGIGGIGVVAPSLGALLKEDSFQSTNAATNLALRYLIGSRMTLAASLASGFFLYVPAEPGGPDASFAERFITSGADLRLEYQWSPKDAIGAELTPIYIYGLHPHGHEFAEAVEATYQRQLTATLAARVGAGPLFVQASSPLYGSLRETSYAANASLSRQIRQSEFTVGYRRAFLVNLLAAPSVANSFYGSAYYPFGRQWIATGTASYARYAGNATVGHGQTYGGNAQLAYQLGLRFQLFASYSILSQNFGSGTSASSGFVRNQFGGGIRYNLGNPITRGGVR